jgi:agmatine deiminase
MIAEAFPTAASAGYRMPAEWTRHERCWMAWPYRVDLWREDLARTQQTYARIANSIAEFEPVTMLAHPLDFDNCRNQCSGKVTVLPALIDDSWARDNGPNFVLNDAGQLAASVFQFNAWGGKHTPWRNDATIGHRIAEYLGIPTYTAPVFMEGGGINVDGEGTLLTTRQCILNPNRNPGMTSDDAEAVLRGALGVDKVIWLPGDPEDTETDGHIDGIACFIEPGKVLVEICPAKGTFRYDNMQANLEAVRGQTDAAGRTLDIEIIEEAHEADRRSEIFASSYINFYIANDAIVMPGFGIDRDKDALGKLASLFPDREIVQVNIADVAVGGGGIHCITQQQPITTNQT